MGSEWLGRFAPSSEIELDAHSGRTCAVDALNWITVYGSGFRNGNSTRIYSGSGEDDVSHVLGTIRGIRRFFHTDITPVFVFDGKFASECRQLTDPNRTSDETPYPQTAFYRESIAKTLSALDIPYIWYPIDGEAGAAELNRMGYVDFTLSNDWDALLFGAETLVREYTNSEPTQLINLGGVLAELELTREELVNIALVVGTDYNDGLHGISAESALDGLRMYGSIDELEARADDSFPPVIDDLRDLLLNPPPIDLEEFGLPTSLPEPEPDIDALRHVLAEYKVPSGFVDSELYYLENVLDARE